MSTEFFNDQWRIPSNENQNKVSNYSMDFDGTSDKIEFGDVNIFDRTDAFSGSCWVYLTGGSVNEYIISKQSNTTLKGYVFYVNSTRKLGFIISRDASVNIAQVLSTSNMPNNTWTHIAFTYDGSSTRAGIKLYINGVLQTVNYYGDANITGSIVDATFPFQISGRDGITTNAVNGKIDQVSIFDYALSATEVSILYGGGTAVTNPMTLSPKPISYYQLGDQSVDNGGAILVPNNSLSDYVFDWFGGVNGTLIQVPSTSNFAFGSGGFGVSLWINFNSVNVAYNILDFRPNGAAAAVGSLWFDPASGVRWYVAPGYKSANIPASSFSINTWYNIVVVNNGSTIYFYLNGNLVDSTTDTTVYIAAPLTIGAYSGGSHTAALSGKLSNISVFNTSLSALNIETIYNNGSPNDISSLNPVSWYKLNAADTFDGSDWTINDYGSGGNDGTSSGMTSANLVVSDLQQTSGYSPYALDFDGINDYLDCGNDSSLQITGAMTISYWVKGTSTLGAAGVGTLGSSSSPGYLLGPTTTRTISFNIGLTSSSLFSASTTQQITTTEWHHIVGVYTPSVSMKIYIDGQLSKTETSNIPSSQYAGGNDFRIGYRTCCQIDGQISNVAIWNTDLSSSEINEIYNEGVPGNLHNFSGTSPVSWWQIGSNSSFNTNWTCLDEIGTNNAVSVNMANDDIVDGPGYSASGLGTSSIDIKGDAPYSTANGLSENMDVLDRTTDVPS